MQYQHTHVQVAQAIWLFFLLRVKSVESVLKGKFATCAIDHPSINFTADLADISKAKVVESSLTLS